MNLPALEIMNQKNREREGEEEEGGGGGEEEGEGRKRGCGAGFVCRYFGLKFLSENRSLAGRRDLASRWFFFHE